MTMTPCSRGITFYGKSLPAPPEPPRFARLVEVVPVDTYGPGFVKYINDDSEIKVLVCSKFIFSASLSRFRAVQLLDLSRERHSKLWHT